ncbi:MAG: two-component regulator propeller domain-containing protein [Balneolaceae bacterium]
MGFSLVPSLLSAQDESIRFGSLTTEQGLSQSTVNEILQDSRGFLWFATDDGLNRYDGYNFIVYRNKPGDKSSISANMITAILEDQQGNLWVGTNGGGLNRFNRKTETFERFLSHPDSAKTISSNNITALYQDFTGVILIGTNSGLSIYEPANKRFSRYSSDNDSGIDLKKSHITDVLKDNSGMIWFGTQRSGLYRFDRFENSFEKFNNGDGSGLTDNWIINLFLDKDNTLWVGTQNGGLHKLNSDRKSFENFRRKGSGRQSLSYNWILSMYEDLYGGFWIGTMNGLTLFDRESNTFRDIGSGRGSLLTNHSITSLLEDKSGVIWIGTKDGGLNKFVRTTESFRVYQHEPGNPESISENNVWAILEDRNSNVWIGTHGGGLNRIDSETKKVTRYSFGSDPEKSISDNFVNALLEDTEGNIWAGTINGLDKIDQTTGRITSFINEPDNPNSISGNIITSLYQDRNDIIWIGTLNNGLTAYDPMDESFRQFKHDPNDPDGISHNRVWTMFEDNQGNFWVGTHGVGLNRYDRVREKFHHYIHDVSNPESISNNFVNFVYQTKKGELWIGTLNGLNRYDYETEAFIRYGVENGLPNNVIYGIVEDDRGHLWLSTNNGIADFDPEKKTVRVYDRGDGLPGNEYRFGAYHKGKSGNLYFGGVDGAVVFEPDSIRDNPFKPPVVFTDFQIFNRPVPIADSSVLKKSITETDSIILNYDQSVFSFQFAGLHYAAPSQNQYAYMLEGFEDNWQYVGSRRFTSYTNLDPGEYVFRVRASNKDGVWNEEGRSLNITITPPFWKTWWATIFYIFAGTGVFLLILNFFNRRERWKKNELEKQKLKLEEEVQTRTVQLAEEMEKGQKLLHNILPAEIANELINTGKSTSKRFEYVTVLFTDFKNFTQIASSMSAQRLVSELNDIFGTFDEIMEKEGVEKIKTIGDSYLAVSGISGEEEDHAVKAVKAAFKMLRFISERNKKESVKWEMRVGIHSGSVIAGIVGKNKFTFDVWGDTVIIAQRMEAKGEPGEINISAVTHDLIKNDFDCLYRGKINADGKGKLDMYFVVKPRLKIARKVGS